MKRIICVLLLIAMLCFSSCTTNSQRNNMKNIYSDDNNYVTIIGKISYIGEGANDSIIIWIEQDSDYSFFQKTASFRIDKNNYDELISNDFLMEISETQYKFTSSEKTFWEGWFYPIVAVESLDENKIYLDFETGKENWLDYIENEI